MIADTKTVTTPPTPKAAAAPVPRGLHEIQVGWLRGNLGEPVKVGLLTGKMFKGKFDAFDQFSLRLTLDSDDSVLVYKHAVAFLAPDLGD